MTPKSFSLIGAGRVGNALAVALHQLGWLCHSVVSRRISSARDLSRRLKDPPVATEVNRVAPARWIFVCVSDDALAEVAAKLAESPIDWRGCVVAHTSGRFSVNLLDGLAAGGGTICALHPAVALTGTATDWQKIGSAVFGVEGSDAALLEAKGLLDELGAGMVRVPAEGKVAYHLACVMVSNYLVTLHHLARVIAGSAEPAMQKLLMHLSRDTLSNLVDHSPAEALTGPMRRGDVGTIAAHLDLLRMKYPELSPLYKELGRHTLELAKHSLKNDGIVQELERLFQK